MDNKHLAFLLLKKVPFGYVMFPDYYENMKDEIDASFEEVSFDIQNLRWHAKLVDVPYKVFTFKKKIKTIKNEQ